MPKVLIETHTFNRKELLCKTIESVLSQSYTDFEYVIINNGSNDNTEKVISKYADKDKRIRHYRLKENNIGMPLIRFIEDILFNSSDAEYYMSIDDDDYMDCNALRKLIGLIEKYDADIAAVGSKWVFPDGQTKDKFVFDGICEWNRVDAMKELLKREKFNSARGGKLYKKDILKIEYPQAERLRDIHREYRVISNANKVVASGEPHYYFYRHDKNSSGLDSKTQITPFKMKEHLEANHQRTEWLTKNMPEITEYINYCEISFMISLYKRIYRLGVDNCYEIAEKMLQYIKKNNEMFSLVEFCNQDEKIFLENLKCNRRRI